MLRQFQNNGANSMFYDNKLAHSFIGVVYDTYFHYGPLLNVNIQPRTDTRTIYNGFAI